MDTSPLLPSPCPPPYPLPTPYHPKLSATVKRVDICLCGLDPRCLLQVAVPDKPQHALISLFNVHHFLPAPSLPDDASAPLSVTGVDLY